MYYSKFQLLTVNLVYILVILKIYKKNNMIEVVWSVNIMIAILIIGVALVLYYIFTYDKEFNS
tara:strand:+ start:184 stop:372 length:189 start_codon:yes stop_codon:yes gene_type:complete